MSTKTTTASTKHSDRICIEKVHKQRCSVTFLLPVTERTEFDLVKSADKSISE